MAALPGTLADTEEDREGIDGWVNSPASCAANAGIRALG